MQTFGIHPSCSNEECAVEMSDDWEGVLDVVDVYLKDDNDAFAYLYYLKFDLTSAWLDVNDKTLLVTSKETLVEAGVQGMAASEIRWRYRPTMFGDCGGLKICPMAAPNLPGPWGDNPWTCTVRGDDCTLPLVLDGATFRACTQQFSDPYDADGDGSQHNGHPKCQSETGVSLCGPCSCSQGEEQTYNMTSVYPHTTSVGLVVCVPCAAGWFKSLGGSGAPKSCEVCPPGSSSPPGATACADCPAGGFNGYEILECASCQPGFFNFVTGQTMCQECAAGRHASTKKSDGMRWMPGGFQFRCEGCRVPVVPTRIFSQQRPDDGVLGVSCGKLSARIWPVRVSQVQRDAGRSRTEPATVDDDDDD